MLAPYIDPELVSTTLLERPRVRNDTRHNATLSGRIEVYMPRSRTDPGRSNLQAKALGPEFNWTKQELLDTYSTYSDLPAKYAVQAGKVLLEGSDLSREDRCSWLSNPEVPISLSPAQDRSDRVFKLQESAAGLARADPASVMRPRWHRISPNQENGGDLGILGFSKL